VATKASDKLINTNSGADAVAGEDEDDSRVPPVGERGREKERAAGCCGVGPRPAHAGGGEGEEEVGCAAGQKEEGRERRPVASFLFLFPFLFSFFSYLVILNWFECNFKCTLNLEMPP
jgi:hypothetical protein